MSRPEEEPGEDDPGASDSAALPNSPVSPVPDASNLSAKLKTGQKAQLRGIVTSVQPGSAPLDEESLLEMEPQGGDETTAPLRVVRGGELVGLPVALFPGLAPPPVAFGNSGPKLPPSVRSPAVVDGAMHSPSCG